MKSNTTTILVAVGALLVGGIATATYMSQRDPAPAPLTAAVDAAPADVAADDATVVESATPEPVQPYADVLKVEPVTGKEKLYGTVIGSEAIRETVATTTPHEVCEDVVVQERAPERDGNAGGTAAGAIIGGLVGNQIGSGSGRKVATVAGAVAGGVIGNKVDKNHVGGQVVERTERQCRTEQVASESTRVTGYNVTYRKPDGGTGTLRTDSKPGTRIALGDTDKVLGYNVTYRYEGEEKTVRVSEKPASDRLPVVNGQVVQQ